MSARWETFALSSCFVSFCFAVRGETPAIQIYFLIPRFRNLHRTWKVNLSYSLPMIYHCKNVIREDMLMTVLFSIYFYFILFYFFALYYLVAVSCTLLSCSSTPTSSTRPFATTSL